MQTDLDWVGRDLQRLATESRLTRVPTIAEWERIWCAAMEWADAFGVVTSTARIDNFVRTHAPGVLREENSFTPVVASPVVVPPPPVSCPGRAVGH